MSKSIWTTAVHAGERAARPDFTPVATPIYPTVAYTYDAMDDLDGVFAGTRQGYVYTRYGNPTVTALETAVAALEAAPQAVAYATGMAAVHAALLGAGARQGATIVSAADVYGASYALLERLLGALGVRAVFVPISDVGAVAEAVRRERPVALYCETISNPLLHLADVGALAELAHGAGASLIVDNTFASPYLVRPLELGADVVVESATKYLAGHGDAMAGLVACDAARAQTLRDQLKLTGGNLGPFEAWLTLRGLKTLPLRMRQQCANAQVVACWLEAHPAITRVNYPGLAEHPQRALAEELMGERGYGAMISFELRDARRETVFRFMEALRLVQPATTLGDVYSLVLYPAHSSHRAMPAELRAQLGIGEGLVRMSVGIEDAADIMADLNQALAQL